MHVITSQAELAKEMAGQKVLQKEAMTPSFEGVQFSCGCGEHHPAKSTPHVACGTLNEFFHQCENRYITLVKYKGIFRVSPKERWSCPTDIFWDFFEGKRDLSDEDIESTMVHLSEIVAEVASVSTDVARAYADDFQEIYLHQIRDGKDPAFVVTWGAILHLSKIANLDNAQSQFLASRAPSDYSSPFAEEITRAICVDSLSKLSGDAKAAVEEAFAKLGKKKNE